MAAQLNGPNGVVLDGAGNLYIADRSNYRIRKVDSAGDISTVAGNGMRGYNGDGGAAVAAQLDSLQAWRWTARATCTSPMETTTASARWTLRG